MPDLNVTYDSKSLIINGKRLFLNSGEIHYFRTDPGQWRDSLEKIKAANLNAVSTYIPWNWHELEEGILDFTGDSHPGRNLARFLDLTKKIDLYVIFRPGPYICSEWLNGGIPTWLLEKYPEILSLDSTGKQTVEYGMWYPPITYRHPVYLQYVRKWYQDIFNFAKPYLCTQGGNIINVQLDDEQSYWRTISESPLIADYSPVIIGGHGYINRYGAWLENKYKRELSQLNRIHRSHYKNFEQASPPHQLPAHYQELPVYFDWYWFKLREIDHYIQNLYGMLKEQGVDVSISTLGHYLGCMMAWSKFRNFLQENHLDIIHTSQYYSAPMFEISDMREDKLGSLVAGIELYKAGIRGANTPPILMEIQSAMSAHLTGSEMEELYHLSTAQGINGHNYYMIAGGENHPDFVLSNGRSYDISAPIGYKGQLREHYYTIRDLGNYLNFLGEDYLKSEVLHDIGVGFYEPYEACMTQGNTLDLGFRDDYRHLFNEYYQYHICAPRGFDFFSLLTHSGVSFSMINLEEVTVGELLQEKQLWVLGLDFMAHTVQQKLVDYVQNGGCLVIFPRIPMFDENMQPCEILLDLFGCQPENPELSRRPSQPLNFRSINFADRRGVLMFDYVDKYTPSQDSKILAVENRTNKVCSFKKRFGKGKAILIGFKLKYVVDAHLDHKAFIEYILEEGSIDRVAYSETGELVVKERTGNGMGYLTVANPTQLTQTSKIFYTCPRTGKRAYLPRQRKELTFNRQGATTMPLAFDIPGWPCQIVYSTAEIASPKNTPEYVEIVIQEEKSSYAELALKINGTLNVEIDDSPAEIIYEPSEGITYISIEMTRPQTRIRIKAS